MQLHRVLPLTPKNHKKHIAQAIRADRLSSSILIKKLLHGPDGDGCEACNAYKVALSIIEV